ncbi:MAG: hypothetical protein OEN50_06700 [Deltaproteobacteria bacterium]|nr:hypothetical protein [Deltaproteobacteria bacterium]
MPKISIDSAPGIPINGVRSYFLDSLFSPDVRIKAASSNPLHEFFDNLVTHWK